MSYDCKKGGILGLNLRYPVTNNMEKTKENLNAFIKQSGFQMENFSDSKPHHVDENDELIQILKKVYEEQTGEKAELLAIGGGTYARSLTLVWPLDRCFQAGKILPIKKMNIYILKIY